MKQKTYFKLLFEESYKTVFKNRLILVPISFKSEKHRAMFYYYLRKIGIRRPYGWVVEENKTVLQKLKKYGKFALIKGDVYLYE